ncbi:MAG: tetratricopeptide repeat protein [Fibrobacterales bacterium]
MRRYNHTDQSNTQGKPTVAKRVLHGFISKALLISAPALLIACASTQKVDVEEPLLPEIDVLQMKENTESALKLSQQSKLDIDVINTRISELERLTIDINNSILSLPIARMEELENKITVLQEEIALIKRILAQSGKFETFNTKDKKLSTPKYVTEPPPLDYKKATKYYHSKEFLPAITLFQKTIMDKSDGPYADDSYFWIGESHYNLGDYAKAIASFKKVFGYINSEKGDNAQFKMAMCNLKLGNKKQAVAEFKKLIIIYPESEFVQKSRLELSKIGVK